MSEEVLRSGRLGGDAGLSDLMSSGGVFANVLPSNLSEIGYDPDAYEASAGVTNAVFHPSLAQSELYAGETILGWKVVDGGHHDAGDYGTYASPLATTLWNLLTGYDIAPEKFPDDVFNIPESGNGVSDLLDEVIHTADFLVRLQDRRNGGVYHKVHSCDWYFDVPQAEAQARFIFAKSTTETAMVAAVLASASRVLAPIAPARSHDYLIAAEKAWKFVIDNPGTVPYGGFQNPSPCGTGCVYPWGVYQIFSVFGKFVLMVWFFLFASRSTMGDEEVFDNILWCV